MYPGSCHPKSIAGLGNFDDPHISSLVNVETTDVADCPSPYTTR